MISVSCAAAGACAAGGYYLDGSSHDQAFVVSETNGSWGNAVEVPGTATLNSGGDAQVNSVSCAAAGACAAGGYYTDGSGHYQAFVVERENGSWGNAVEVPGTATLNSGGNALVNSVSCARPGACAAGGYYTDGSGHVQAFVVERDKRQLGRRGRSAGHSDPQQRRQRRGELGLVCRGGRLPAGGHVHGRLRRPPGVRGRARRTAAGATRSKCPARRPSTAAATPS